MYISTLRVVSDKIGRHQFGQRQQIDTLDQQRTQNILFARDYGRWLRRPKLERPRAPLKESETHDANRPYPPRALRSRRLRWCSQRLHHAHGRNLPRHLRHRQKRPYPRNIAYGRSHRRL